MEEQVPRVQRGPRSFDDAALISQVLGNGVNDAPFDDEGLRELLSSLGPNALGENVTYETEQAEDNEWKDLELYTEKHQVHRVENEGTADKGYVVSNLRKFEVTVILMDSKTRTPSHRALQLRASLLYENSKPVRTANGEAALLGNTTAATRSGRAVFRLQMGKRSLSAQHDRQRFRIKIEPVDADLATRYPCLSQLTAPLKSVTKLNAAGRAVAGATSSVAVAANTPHSGGANATGIPDYTGLRSLQDLDTSSSLVASLPRPTMPPLGHLPPPPLARSSSHTSTSVQTGFAEPTFDLEAVAHEAMRQEVQHPSRGQAQAERESIQAIMEQQRAQIEELTRQNAVILQELANLQRQQSD